MILNFGSINIDHVYNVAHISRAGETIASDSYRVFAGGKGANQTAALALAGAEVAHGGMVGPDGRWLVEKLASLGAETRCITPPPTTVRLDTQSYRLTTRERTRSYCMEELTRRYREDTSQTAWRNVKVEISYCYRMN